jgi:hypothetical protein
MLSFRRGVSGVLCAVGLLLSGACAARSPQPTPVQAPQQVVAPESAPAPAAQPDPVQELIALSEQHFQTGERELSEGHLDAATTAFDRAVDILLESPGGARSTPELSAHYDRLIERISGHELTALAQADGFAEKAAEPASIDDLLTIATFERPTPSPETERTVANDLQAVVHDIEIPQNAGVADVAAVDDVVAALQEREHLWAEQTVRVGDEADAHQLTAMRSVSPVATSCSRPSVWA